ncbi:hypothetical protein TNCV_2771381 [Trichonephila clavipes]|nr:hypothetical protein TNCV_2771381 [Trichonephila clavipes]
MRKKAAWASEIWCSVVGGQWENTHGNAKPYSNSWLGAPHSPDFAPSDLHLSPDLKKNLACRRFGSNSEVKQTVKHFFRLKSPLFLAPWAKTLKYFFLTF